VEEYAERGYLPDVIVNFLALLGWSLDGESTIIPREVLCREFSLNRITRKDAIFDEVKLDWMNAQYIKAMDRPSWVKASEPWLLRAHARGCALESTEIVEAPAEDAVEGDGFALSEGQRLAAAADMAARPAFYEALYPLIAEREQRLTECGEKLEYLFWGPNVRLDRKSVDKVLLKEDKKPREVLERTREILADESIAWECEPLQERVRALVDELDLKVKFVFQPIRVAICGNMVSPPLFESVELLERQDVLARIDRTLATVYGA
jgi:glutamyl-tRNA synthetase